MPSTTSRVGLVYRDVRGASSTMRFFVTYDTAANGLTYLTGLVSAINGITNAVFNGSNGVGFIAPNPTLYGANAEFSTIEDKANFTFVDNLGTIHRYQVPAPKDTIFLADGQTVDPANVLALAFINAVTTATAGPSFASNRDGIHVNFFAGGTRIRRKIRRKISIFTLDPTLSGPDE